LAFEDSVAGARAEMRVVWVPHLDVVAEYQRKDVLAGETGMIEIGRRQLASRKG
jgi:pseudouridine-5'-monophosphatase